MLTLQSQDPVVVDLGEGASVTLAPVTPRIVASGRRAVRVAFDADPEIDAAESALIYSEGVLRTAITALHGIGTADGKLLTFSPEAVELLLADHATFALLERAYVVPIMAREMEKNGSAASSDGTSVGATAGTNTAGTAAGSTPAAGNRKARRSTASKSKKAPAKD